MSLSSQHFTLKVRTKKSIPWCSSWYLLLSIICHPSPSLFLSLLLSARVQYWCSTKVGVAKVLNWHDRAIKEHQRSILPLFTLPHRSLLVHLPHTLTDKRQSFCTYFLHLCSYHLPQSHTHYLYLVPVYAYRWF